MGNLCSAARLADTENFDQPVELALDKRGVRLKVLEMLLKEENAGSMNGEELREAFIWPRTRSSGCSYSEWLTQNPDTNSLVGEINIFISHAWKYKFEDLVSCIRQFEEFDKELAHRRPFYYFIDYFAVNQHSPGQDLGLLQNMIYKSEAVLLCLSPFNDPIPLKRSWCVFEMMHGIQSPTTKLLIALAGQEWERLKQALLEDFTVVIKAFTNIDAEKAEASVLKDKENIARNIKEQLGGFAKVNEVVMHTIRTWVEDRAKQLLSKMHQKSVYFSSHEEEKQLGNAYFQIGNFFRKEGMLADSEEILKNAVEYNDRILGKEALLSCKCRINLAIVYKKQGRLEESDKLWSSTLLTEMQEFGIENEETVKSHRGYMALLLKLNRVDEAAEIFKMFLPLQIKLFGEDHIETLRMEITNGVILTVQNKLEEARDVLIKTRERHKKILGNRHPQTTKATFRLAAVLDELKDEGSLELYEECHRMNRQILGEKHPHTQRCVPIIERLKYVEYVKSDSHINL